MTRTLAITRFGVGCVACVLAAGLPVAGVAHGHYAMQGTLKAEKNIPAAGLQLQATFSRERVVLTGGAHVLAAHIDDPYGCGSDTIFANGFDP